MVKADAEIVRLIAGRIRIVEEIGGEKKKEGWQITDAEREKIVLEHVRKLARDESINQDDIEGIYRQIMMVAKSVEGGQVAFQGEIGAYSEEAAFNFFGYSIQAKPCESLEEVFRSVEQDEVQYGIIAIENSLEGTISRSYDLLLGSAHPQGGNGMSENPQQGVVGNDFGVHGVENLYVADASVFPTNIWANCQATVMAMAHYAASEISN